MKIKDLYINYEIINKKILFLARESLRKSDLEIVDIIKGIVPEYLSNNSAFETLDKIEK